MERGLEFQEYIFHGGVDDIMTLGWRRFVKSLEATFVFIVREFYANVSNSVDDKAMVKVYYTF